jgi:hypothetical protein
MDIVFCEIWKLGLNDQKVYWISNLICNMTQLTSWPVADLHLLWGWTRVDRLWNLKDCSVVRSLLQGIGLNNDNISLFHVASCEQLRPFPLLIGYDHIPVFVVTHPFCTGLNYMEGVNQIGSAHSFFPELNFGANAVCVLFWHSIWPSYILSAFVMCLYLNGQETFFVILR